MMGGEILSDDVAKAVLQAAADQCKATPELVKSKDRRRFIVEARQLVTAILREGGWGFQEIANFLTEETIGNHTNPHHWYKMHNKDYEMYDYYKISYDILKSIHGENIDEFKANKAKLIDIERYIDLKQKFDQLKLKHDALSMENKLIKQSANKLKSQINKLWS